MFLLRLAISNLRGHKVRIALTVAAIALSVSLVVAVTSGHASVEGVAVKFLNQYMGATDAQITSTIDAPGSIPQSLVGELRRDGAVANAVGRLELENGLIDAQGKPLPASAVQVYGLMRPDDTQVDSLRMDSGHWFNSDRGNVAVVDQVVAGLLKVKVGDSFELPGINGRLKLQVVGITHKPEILAQYMRTIYLPLQTMRDFALPDKPQGLNRILIDLRRGAEPVDAEAFATRWRERLAQTYPGLRLRLAHENRREMERNFEGLHILSYLGGTVSMLAATFIVFSALSMGVAERQRTLAMLRAVGTLRWQVGALVVFEGLLLAAAGVLVGVPLGWAWGQLMAWRFPEFFPTGLILSWGGVVFGIVGSVLAAVLASFLPAWAAMRVSPLEAMAPLAAPRPHRLPLGPTIAGLLLIAIDPFLMLGPLQYVLGLAGPAAQPLLRPIQFYGHFIVGLPGLMIGFFLLAPLCVYAAECLLGPLVARCFGLQADLLRQQLAGALWRAAGTCAALMVGLAVLVVLQIQGTTLLSGWRLPDKFPDIFIISPLRQLGPAEQAKLEAVPGMKAGQVMPVAIASPELGNNIFAIAGAAVLPDATMFIGVDPDKVSKMMGLDFREGDMASAVAALKQGRHLIITEEFRQLKNLHVGDKFALKTPRHGTVQYTIAGVVWSPGIDVVVSMFDMNRQFEQRTFGTVFGTLEDAREDFAVDGVYIFAANLDYFMDKDQLVKNVQRALGLWGLKAGDIRHIKKDIQDTFHHMLMLVSSIAFAAMGVASLGVTNTIMASIRSRRWEFGILRAVGVTRGQLLRLVLAESFLLGLVACVLGLGAGLEMSIDAGALTTHLLGYRPPTIVPWPIILIGVAIVMGISLIASFLPAFRLARTEPLSLLQGGRAAA